VNPGVTVGGIPVTLLDTAGVREAVDAAEQIGVQRSAAAARAADIVIMVTDAAVGVL
jgi:tRNA modification GTPase